MVAARDDSDPLTARKIAAFFGCSSASTLEYLHDLVDRGEVTSKAVTNDFRVWWVPSPENERDVLSGYGSLTGTDRSSKSAVKREPPAFARTAVRGPERRRLPDYSSDTSNPSKIRNSSSSEIASDCRQAWATL